VQGEDGRERDNRNFIVHLLAPEGDEFTNLLRLHSQARRRW